MTAPSPPRLIVPDLAEHRDGSEEILLRKDERDHVRSRRLRDGDEVVLLDGEGTRARARVVRRGTAVAVSFFEASAGLPVSLLPGEPRLRVTVALACAEPARVEWAVEKGTECGAACFVLLEAARSQRAHVASLRTRLGRLARIAAEATKQCDRTIVPAIEGPVETGSFLREEVSRGSARRAILLADPAGRPPSERASGLAAPAASGPGVVVAIGPEGGFTPSEVSLFDGHGALRISLGPRILRLETAVVAALAHLVGDG